jgi:hypothetical protein
VISDTGQDMGQVGTRVNTVEFACADERVHRGRALAPTVRAGKQEILSSMHIFALTK